MLAQYVTRIKKWSIALGVACAHAVPCRLPERLQLNCLYSVGTQHNQKLKSETPERAYKGQAPFVRKLDDAIHRINLYRGYSAVRFAFTYLLNSNVSVK